jgi:hypothetical protein
VATAGAQYQAAHPDASLRILTSEPETLWHKLDHLLYLPILGLVRPRDLYYYQGPGLRSLYGFTYKYLPLEHFLGHLTRLQVGLPLAAALAHRYSQSWYPGRAPLFIFTDWHVKPHWTKEDHLSGHVTMWGRVMPGTKQLLVNGPEGHLLGGWNYAVDSHLTHVLVDLEADLATILERPLAYTVCDSEGGGAPLAQRYATAGRDHISVLPRGETHRLSDFAVQGEWQPVVDDPTHEAAEARWQDAQRAQSDPRRLVLLRRVGDDDPTRIYAGRIPVSLPAAAVPAQHRQRWACQERKIQALIHGANLNANFGYTTTWVPDRTEQRRWEKAQAQVEVSERRLSEQSQAVTNLTGQITACQQATAEAQAALEAQLADRQAEIAQRQAEGRVWRRCQQGLHRLQAALRQVQTRGVRQLARLRAKLKQHQEQQAAVQAELSERVAARETLDTTALCRERDLQKDQIMLDLQVLLASLHDWVRQEYLAPEWQRLELDTATQLLYRKAGQVIWGPDTIEVVFDHYRYADQQRAMEETCRRFNAAQRWWRDGRLLRFRVAASP